MVTTKRENVLEPAIFANISKAAGSSSPAEPIEQNVEWVDDITVIDKNVLLNSAFKSIVFPDSITSITMNAYNGSAILEKVTFPNNVSIDSGTFSNCAQLVEICAPDYKGAEWDGEAHVINGAFTMCTKLKQVRIPYGTTSLSNSNFGGCAALESVEIPETVETIDNTDFGGCTALTEINIHKPEGSIEGAPWGATNATVNWLG